MKAPARAQLPGAESPLMDFMAAPNQRVPNNPDNLPEPGGPRVMNRYYRRSGEPAIVMPSTTVQLRPTWPGFIMPGRGRNNFLVGDPRLQRTTGQAMQVLQGGNAATRPLPMGSQPLPKPGPGAKGVNTSLGGMQRQVGRA